MSDGTDIRRQLRIKCGSVKRLAQELKLYAQEQEKETQKVAKMKNEDADSHDIKHAENVLAEATMMIPDTQQRLDAAYEDLYSTMRDAGEDVKSSEEGVTAQTLLSDLKDVASPE